RHAEPPLRQRLVHQALDLYAPILLSHVLRQLQCPSDIGAHATAPDPRDTSGGRAVRTTSSGRGGHTTRPAAYSTPLKPHSETEGTPSHVRSVSHPVRGATRPRRASEASVRCSVRGVPAHAGVSGSSRSSRARSTAWRRSCTPSLR